MAAPVTPNVGPINRVMLGAAAALGLAWTFSPSSPSDVTGLALSGACALAGAAMLVTGSGRLLRDYRIRKLVALSKQVSEDHGSAREATREELNSANMDHETDLLGLAKDGRPVWRPRQLPFSLIEMPPGGGKSVCYVVPWIISRAASGHSLVIADPKCELYPMLGRSLKARGIEVWACHPAGNKVDVTDLVELNPLQALIDAIHSLGASRKDAVRLAADMAAIFYPPSSDEKNPYFAHGSRRVFIVAAVSEALLNPAGCTPSSIYSLITNPGAFMERLLLLSRDLEMIDAGDEIAEFLRTEARNLLHRAEANEENYASFLEGMSQRLLPFNPAGHLGGYGAGGFRKVSELREKQIALFVMSPLSHTREFSTFVSLLNHGIIAAVKAAPNGHKLHIIAEEALNYRFHELASDMETLRQLGLSADFFIQGFSGLEKAYGRDTARSIESYADVRIYAGLNSYERAKHVSDMLSDATLRKQDFSYQSRASDVNISTGEHPRKLAQVNEILAMPREKAWVFVRGMNPMKLRMVHYGEVDWWRDAVDPSPITGTRLRSTPILKVTPFPETKNA